MNIKMYGSSYCQDTLFALYKLKEKGATVEFLNISTNFPALRDFMNMRESKAVFAPVKERGGLGMPFMILEDGTETLDLDEVLAKL